MAADTTTPTQTPDPGPTDTLHLTRWTVTSGSNANSRGAVVIAAGDHQWEASAEGNGAVDALFRAVDRALAGVLTGHPRLLSYDVHAVAEGPDAEGKVTVAIAPPSDAGGPRSSGRYVGEITSTNIIAASAIALADSLEYAIWKSGAELRRRDERHFTTASVSPAATSSTGR